MKDYHLSASENVPKISVVQKYIGFFGVLIIWLGVGGLVIAKLPINSQIVFAIQCFWFFFCAGFSWSGISKLYIEISDDGVMKRGISGTIFIPWSEANVVYGPLFIRIASRGKRIEINPFVFNSRVRLYEFIGEKMSAQKGGFNE